MNRRGAVEAAGLFLAGVCGCVAPRPGSPPGVDGMAAGASVTALADSLDAQAPRWLARDGVPSIAVAYVAGDSVRWTRVYGEQAPGVPATRRTLYNVASLTKPVFAELVLRLAADQRLSLDEPMAPTWVDPDIATDPRHRALTPRLVLSHRTGFANWRRATGGVLRFQADPGSAYGYSGEGYEYLARFVERRTDAPLDSLARRYLFRPFGMRDAAFMPQPWFEGRVARPSTSRGTFGEPAFSARGNAADMLYATADDYARFLVATMRRGALPPAYARQRDSVHVPDPGTIADCKPRARVRCPDVAGPGLGWAVMRFAADSGRPAETVLWHTGSDEGMRAMVVYLPARRQGAVMLANGDNGFQTMIDVGRLLFAESAFSAYLLSGRE